MEILEARIAVARKRWALAQELRIWTFPEQDADAKLLEWAFGKLPD